MVDRDLSDGARYAGVGDASRGDELLVLLSGEIDVVVEGVDGNRTVELRAGPAVWFHAAHGTSRSFARRSELVVTYGKGTNIGRIAPLSAARRPLDRTDLAPW